MTKSTIGGALYVKSFRFPFKGILVKLEKKWKIISYISLDVIIFGHKVKNRQNGTWKLFTTTYHS